MPHDDVLPSYDDLPVRPDAPPGSSWGVWGDGDRLGCLNLLTAERVARAATLVRRGAVFALNLDVGLPDPPLFNRNRGFRHEVTGALDGPSHDDVLHAWNTQSSSQWDGFRHIRHPEHGFYAGLADDDHGMQHWARRGLAGRGILCDVGRWREAQGRPLRHDRPDPIEPDEVRACLADQGTEVEVGDVLLLRTGWVGWYRGVDADARAHLADHLAAPGLRPGRDTARLLWDLHVAAVAADNPALEVWPVGALEEEGGQERVRADWIRTPEVFVHTALLPLLGLPIGELWDLEALADDCASEGTYECFLTSAPLNLEAGVASPPNALALR